MHRFYCCWWPMELSNSTVRVPIPLEVDPEGDALFMESAQPFDDHFPVAALTGSPAGHALKAGLRDFIARDFDPPARDFGPELADRARAARRAGLTNWTGR